MSKRKDPLWTVTDTVTYARTFEIRAASAEDAIKIADSGRRKPMKEEQTDNTPWCAVTNHRVMLHENRGDKFTIIFDCMAEDADHADEQAKAAYPAGEVLSVSRFRV